MTKPVFTNEELLKVASDVLKDAREQDSVVPDEATILASAVQRLLNPSDTISVIVDAGAPEPPESYSAVWCEECGSREVECLAWYSPNDGTTSDIYGDDPGTGSSSCANCDDPPTLVWGKRCCECDANMEGYDLPMNEPERCDDCADPSAAVEAGKFTLNSARWEVLKLDKDGERVVPLPLGSRVSVRVEELPKVATYEDICKALDTGQGVNPENIDLVWPWFYDGEKGARQ